MVIARSLRQINAPWPLLPTPLSDPAHNMKFSGLGSDSHCAVRWVFIELCRKQSWTREPGLVLEDPRFCWDLLGERPFQCKGLVDGGGGKIAPANSHFTGT